ncbi:uncharacterized protein LOC126895568 [Daktulosphaira vitifoliae]|uniref:uncharacterized protein LOC126895568 n=1 Tax=Daktulosphaira vitifoliae TaxID=58002 RepID=UPI0021A9BB46|nr:uncharacterized protein LOC126895568 [Daktulosphaira vitifoliae]
MLPKVVLLFIPLFVLFVLNIDTTDGEVVISENMLQDCLNEKEFHHHVVFMHTGTFKLNFKYILYLIKFTAIQDKMTVDEMKKLCHKKLSLYICSPYKNEKNFELLRECIALVKKCSNEYTVFVYDSEKIGKSFSQLNSKNKGRIIPSWLFNSKQDTNDKL